MKYVSPDTNAISFLHTSMEAHTDKYTNSYYLEYNNLLGQYLRKVIQICLSSHGKEMKVRDSGFSWECVF